MNLFEYAKMKDYNVYPELLGYNYPELVTREFIDKLNEYEFVFITSDYSITIPCKCKQFMTSAENPGTYMWLLQDFSGYHRMPESKFR